MSTNEPQWIVEIATWLATYALHGVLWFALAWSLTRLLKTPQLREWTWKASVVGALLSASLIGEFGGGERPLAWRLEESAALPSAPVVQSGLMTQAAGDPAPRVVQTDSPVPAAGLSGAEQSSSGFAWSSIPFASLLVAVWAAGALLCVAQLLLSRRRCLRELRAGSTPAEVSTQRYLNRILGLSGLGRRVNLRVTTQLASPIAIAGGGLYLPSAVVETMGDDEQEAVLAHELAHIVRRDPEWQLALALLARIFFFQPLLRFSARRIETEAELLCDDRAVAWSGKSIALARGLRQVAIWSIRSERVPAWSGAAMVLPAEAGSSALVSRVERLLSRSEAPSSMRARIGTLVCIGGFATAMACAGPEVSADNPPEHIDVVVTSEQTEEDPDGWIELMPTLPLDRSEYEPEDFYCFVSLREDGRVAVRFPKRNLNGDAESGVTMGSEVVVSGMNPLLFDTVFQTFKDSPAESEIPVVIKVAASSETRAWLRLLEMFATRGERAIAFQLEGERRIPAALAASDSVDSDPKAPPVVTLDISVLKAGRKVDVESGEAWSGSGPYHFEDRSIMYTAGTEADAPDGSGMSASQGMAVDSLAGMAFFLNQLKSTSPELSARISAGEGTIYGDVAPLLDVLLEAGFVDIEFSGLPR